jgi:hypothetical protein
LSNSQSGSGQILVKNIGNDSINVTIDKKRLLKDSSHLELIDNGIADWITLNPPTSFSLKPGETKTISFKITAPAQFNYYDAVGAITINGLPVPPGGSNSSTPIFNIQQGVQLVIPVIVGLPGPIIESLQMIQHSAPTVLLSYMPGDFVYQLNNNGTVYANMTGNIEINGLLSKHSVPIQGGVYPEDNYTLTAQWTPGFADFGLYSADTNINYGRYQQDKLLQVHDTILVIPVWLILIIILALGIWIIRKKEIQSPINIKIERKK